METLVMEETPVMETPRSRLARIYARSHRGMTLLEIMIVLAILALVMGLLVGPKVMKMFGEAKGDTVKIKVKKYAYEAYPSWSAAHPEKGCPEKLSDLNEYMNDNDSNDAWGKPLKMMCGASLPPGARGIAVMSAGEDGKEGTPDDIKSWE
ncbi:MAG TPA: prepilin-type N-terminal cleavage/methylation domain-containing protein [Kofleriaceae bacterium]|nr:prepilin-type N-terminal cleavage/methylation domain-containing protein [Kofleriaceae bacterium]